MREFRWSHVNPYCILKDLLVNLWVVILCAAIAWMGTQIVLENLYRPEYTSAATYYITPRDSTKPAYSNISTGGQMAGALVSVFQSQVLEQKTAEAMGLERLTASVMASQIQYTNLLRLQAVAGSPEEAFRTMRAIMDTHPKVSDYVVNNAVVEVLEPPTVPSGPSNFIPLRQTQRSAALIAALLAVAALLALSVLRDTVKTEVAVREMIDAPLYGTLPEEIKNKTLRSKLRNLNKAVLITNPTTSFQFSEAIKRICTKMEYAASLRGIKTFLIASASENEGKSTAAVNLALGLLKRGYRVLLLDGDLKRPAVYKLLDRSAVTIKELSSYLHGRASLEDVIAVDERTGLHLLINRHSSRNSADLLASPQMTQLIHDVAGMMDFVIVDSPPLALAADTEALSALCDAALLVVRQDHSYVQTVNDAVDKLSDNTELLGCIFNRQHTLPLPGGSAGRRYDYYYRKA